MAKLCLVILVLSVVLVNVALAKQDPELKQCKHQCGQQQKEQCVRECEEYIRQKEERERHEKGRGGHGGGGGGGQGWENDCTTEESCQKKQQQQEEEEEKPYVFEDDHFETHVKTEQGRIRLLPKFTDRSELLRGIENYRLGFLEANPRAFMSPVHFDADSVHLVVQGRVTATIVKEDKRESTNLKAGDLFMVPAGNPVYMVNSHENESLFLVSLRIPVSLPGQFEGFHGAAGEDPESFYTAFSWHLLAAALNTERDRLEWLFRQQKRGGIIEASPEQIQEMTKHAEGGSVIWPFGGGDSFDSINIFRKRPSHSNKYGQLREVKPNEFEHFRDLNLMVSFANITRGAMSGPVFNSRATKICFVVDGDGYLEMACPHLSSGSSAASEEEQYGQGQSNPTKRSRKYQRVSGQLRRVTAFIVLAGHPFALVASPTNNLQVVCFEINAKGNIRYPLAGKGNFVKNMEGMAKELAFNVPRREADRIFGNQDKDLFFPGPGQQEQGRGGRAYA